MSSTEPATLQSTSWIDLFARDSAPKTLILAAGVALHAINVYIVTTILPSVVQDIGGLNYYAWNTALFIVAAIAGSTLSANLEARSGPKLAYWVALGVFAAGSAVCASAPLMAWLLIGRSIQGLGGGLLCALSYSLIRTVFPSALWTRAMGLVSGMWGLGTLCGPAIGGIFGQTGSWRSAFWILLPVCGFLAVLADRCLPGRTTTSSAKRALPTLQIVALMSSVALISMASVVEGMAWRIVLIASGALIASSLPFLDKRLPARLLPEGAYSLSTRLGQIYACMAMLSVGISTEIFVPYFLQAIHGLASLWAGYLTAAMAAGWTIGSMMSSSAPSRSVRHAVRGGPVVLAVALATLALLLPRQAEVFGIHFLLMCAALTATGMGVGLGWPHLLANVLKEAPAGQESLASASITTVQLYASALGAAVAGLVANAAGLVDPGGAVGAASAASWLFSMFTLPAIAAIWLACRFTKGRS